jgi:tetratricopeptide (TPR) repeat protein
LFRIALTTLVPLSVLTPAEVLLRLFGYGHPTSFFVKMHDGRSYTANRYFGLQFFSKETSTYPHPFVLTARKAPGTIRIFILGESAALGTPAPQFGFGRILEVMLRPQYPERRFEVINAAMRGVDSNIILPIAKECAQHDPDLFLVYMGNNEAVGRYAPDPESTNLRSNLRWLRMEQRLKRTRLCQWLESMARKIAPQSEKKIQDMEFFRKHRLAADDPRRESVYRNFRENLRDICRVTRASGARVIVSTVGANLKDFPPFASLHRADLTEAKTISWESASAQGTSVEGAGQFEAAIRSFLEASRMDDHFADLHFRLGRCYLASNQIKKAQEHYTLARDWDALPFRSDSRLNGIIRNTASGNKAEGISLVDAEQALEESSESHIPGHPIFNDHVHFSFEGDYLMAKTFLPAVAAAPPSAATRGRKFLMRSVPGCGLLAPWMPDLLPPGEAMR